MKVKYYYQEAILGKHHSLILLIDYLVNKRKVLKMTDSEDKLTYFLQDKFGKKMNEYLVEYERSKRNE